LGLYERSDLRDLGCQIPLQKSIPSLEIGRDYIQGDKPNFKLWRTRNRRKILI
jgi:hypothetical protein